MSHSSTRIIVAISLFAALLTTIGIAPPALRVASGFIACLYLPGFAALLLLRRFERSLLDSIIFPLILSPIVLALALLAAVSLTGSIHASMRIAVGAFACLAAGVLVLSRGSGDEAGGAVPRGVLVVSIAFAALLACSYAANGFLLVRSDAWYHASVVSEIVRRGIPPMEPWFADEPIRYMWIYHLFVAGLADATGVSVPWALALLNIASALAFPYLVARITVFFTREPRVVIGASIFAVAGLESASWILWPVMFVRALFGEVRGRVEIMRLLGEMHLDGNQVVHALTPYGTWMVNLIDKFFVLTSFNYAIDLFLFCLILMLSREFQRRSPVAASVTVGVIVLGAFLFHIIIGTALILVIVGAAVLFGVFRRPFIGDRSTRRFLSIGASAAAVAAASVGFPYFASLVGGAGGEGALRSYVHVGIRNILTIAAPLAVLFVAVRGAARAAARSASDSYRILGAWILCLLVLNVFVDLPMRNESKLVFPLFLLLGPPIYWFLIEDIAGTRGARRILRIGVVALLFAVPPALTIRGFFLEHPTHPIDMRRSSITADEREIFRWIDERTPLDAVVMEANVYGWMPLYAGRRDFFPHEGTINVLGYGGARVNRMRGARDAIFSDRPVAEEDMRFLRSFPETILIVVWREDVERVPALGGKFDSYPEWFERIFGNGAGTVFLVKEEDGENEGGRRARS